MGRITLACHFDRFPFSISPFDENCLLFEAAPMLGDALDNLGDIDICKELPNLLKTDAGVIEQANNLKRSVPLFNVLADIADKAEKFASDAAEAVGEKQTEIRIAKDQIALARIERRRKSRTS